MFLSRIFGRTLFAAAKSETSTATAAAASAARNPLEEFFEADRSVEDDKPVVYGTCISFSFSVCSLPLLVVLLFYS